MNVLDFYHSNHIGIAEPIELEDDHYFCKLTYNQAPFIVKTNKVCYYKNKKNTNSLYISITSKEYLEWFESFYHDIIDQFHTLSNDWFEDPLTKTDIECSFINPLKTNIKDNCFDIMCGLDENRMMITDTNDNMCTLDKLGSQDVIPTFHIKGIKFNSKHFSLDIELHHLYVLLPESNLSDSPQVSLPQVSLPQVSLPQVSLPSVDPVIEPEPIPETEELDEYKIDTSELPDYEHPPNELSIYKVYEFLNTKIKESMIEDIRGIFTSKKIKTKLDFSEVVDDEDLDE
jgi:hypothetical protein